MFARKSSSAFKFYLTVSLCIKLIYHTSIKRWRKNLSSSLSYRCDIGHPDILESYHKIITCWNIPQLMIRGDQTGHLSIFVLNQSVKRSFLPQMSRSITWKHIIQIELSVSTKMSLRFVILFIWLWSDDRFCLSSLLSHAFPALFRRPTCFLWHLWMQSANLFFIKIMLLEEPLMHWWDHICFLATSRHRSHVPLSASLHDVFSCYSSGHCVVHNDA